MEKIVTVTIRYRPGIMHILIPEYSVNSIVVRLSHWQEIIKWFIIHKKRTKKLIVFSTQIHNFLY